ncbi:hypothetical protein IAD21_03038 [Abditibacteriota bacterium]|nr:hypothetical protein IAD21_03038 [Abditibacteriota bacterium]
MICQVENRASSPLSGNEDTPKIVASAWELERDSAQLSRGISSPRSWSEITEDARSVVRLAANWPAPRRAGWSDDSHDEIYTAALQSAARALDCVSLRATTGGPSAREAGLWAACAFALGGNFPSACVVLKRTFPSLDSRSSLIPLASQRAWKDGAAALIAAFAPTLSPLVADHSPFAARVASGALNDEDEDIFSLLKAEVGPEWFELARASFMGARALSSLTTLDERGGFLRGHKWSEALANRVPLLLPTQKMALDRGFLEREAGAIAALPPGTGKTWLGELFLFERLARAEANLTTEQAAPLAVFLVPYVALGRGVASALKKHARGLGVEVRVWLSGEGDETELPTTPAIIVATPERFDGAWRTDLKLGERLCGVVVDEAHLIADGARGARLETLIARLKMAEVRLLFLSAATGDAAPLGDWIGAPTQLQLHSNWTPTARRLAFWRQKGVLEWHGELAGRGLIPLGETPLSWPRRELRAGDGWVQMQKQEGAVWNNVAHLARTRWEEHGGAVLCLCATRRGVRQLARALMASFPEQTEASGARAQALSLIETRHRTLLPLARLLKHGIAWHSAALPSDLRSLIERAVTEGEIRALASTRTLAEGVDLPWNQTILADWLSWNERGWHPMDPGLFRNIAGRCGRAGAFTEGDTYIFDNPLGPSEWTAPDVRADVQRTQFLEASRPAPPSAMQERDGQSLAPALSAAWESGLTALLAWHTSQRGPLDINELAGAFYLSDRDHARWNEALQNTLDAWLVGDWAQLEADGRWTSTPRGQALARADLSPQTARRLLDALASLPRRAPLASDEAARINTQLWHVLQNASEDDNSSLWAPHSKFAVRPADLTCIAHHWLEGVPIAAMFASLPRVRQSKGFPGEAPLRAWLDGENESGHKMDEFDADWTQQFDRFGDWTRSSLGIWAPRLWRACTALSPLVTTRPDLKTWEWNRFAARFAGGVSTDWAVAALRRGAPGGRETLATWGRFWPFPSTTADPLALFPLAHDEEHALNRAESAFASSLHEVGGAFCARGTSVKALRDWLWAHAGATK